MAAIDKLVASRPQFMVYSQLANRFQKGTNGSSATSQNGAARKGLTWVVALARLEAGAILATFTTIPAPFEIVGPSQYEMPAYKELLMDGAKHITGH
ncbi:MAG: hypothetical protein QM703_04120 [Gemmatales bacterium]